MIKREPCIWVAAILLASRLCGMRMNDGSPAAAAFAATELARFPVDAQPTASSLNSSALLIATAVTRSLKESVGQFTLSFFKYRLSIPSFLPSRSARTSGVPPVDSPIFGSDSSGSNSQYFQIVLGREERASRVNFLAIAS